MNSTNTLVLFVIVAVLAGSFWWLVSEDGEMADVMMETVSTADDAAMMDKEDTQVSGNETTKDGGTMGEQAGDGSMMEDTGAGMMLQKGGYEAYAPEKLSFAETGDVVLFFRASWCPTCRALDGDIRGNLNSIPAGVMILDVNYDNSTALKQKYGVTYQHTLVQVDSKGNLIAKWRGSPTLAALLANIK